MKPFLVDVPVRVNIWIRPECQKRQFEVLKKARPSVMFLISDGGRNEKEWDDIHKNREMIDNGIDWECTVYRLYEEKNNGLYSMSRKASELVWSNVDRCIFLEDDYVPSISYFSFCAELLEKYKDDLRIHAICGMNHSGIWENANSDYIFTKSGSIWGMAFWKRSVENRDYNFEYANDPYVMKLLRYHTKKNVGYYEQLEGYAKDSLYGGHMAGGEFFHALDVFSQSKMLIVPKCNMISNIGCTEDSAHASTYKLLPRGVRKCFNMKTYEIDREIKHPKYVIDDVYYDEYVLKSMAVGHPFIAFGRKIESIFLRLKYKGISGLIQKVKQKIKKRKRIET